MNSFRDVRVPFLYIGTSSIFRIGSKYPPTGTDVGTTDFTPNVFQIYPEYLTDARIFLCPSAPDGTDVEQVMDDANANSHIPPLTDVIISQDGQRLGGPGDPAKFYPCEEGNDAGAYAYVGFLQDITGVTDKPDDPSYSGFLSHDNGGDTVNPGILLGANPLLLAEFGAVSALDNLAADAFDIEPWMSDVPSDFVDAVAGSFGIPTPTGLGDLRKLREGIERFLVTDINNPAGSAKGQTSIWVMEDWISCDIGQETAHVPGGSNVLYMDGHVEFVKYPTKWPVNRVMAGVQAI